MRLTLVCAALSVLAIAGTARAQTATASGMCMGMDSSGGTIAGTVGLAVPGTNGTTFSSVAAASVPYVFGAAECDCTPDESDQINLEIQLTSAFGNSDTPATVEVWVGSGCDTYTTRTTVGETVCEKLTTGIPQFTNFTTASNAGLLIHIPIPGNALTAPVTHQCTNATVSNSIYVFIFNDPTMPSASCTLTGLTEQGQPPTAVTGITAGSGDSSVTLTWTAPPQNSFSPAGYQVLCTDDCGNQIKTSHSAAQYSTCVNGVLQRRTIPTGGTLPSTGDAGVVNPDMAIFTSLTGQFEPEAEPEATPAAEPAMGCGGDGGTSVFTGDMASITNDMGTVVNNGPLTSMDPRFICSGMIGATGNSARITGLNNNTRYHFTVLSYDLFGNASASAVVDAIPQPTEDLYRRYRDAGGAAGGCFIATAAFGSYESDWVYILRDFRDQVLLPSDVGHSFVDWYYANSPPGAAWIAERPWARAVTRVALLPFIAGAFFWVYFAAWQKALFLLLLAALIMRKRIAAAIERGQRA